MALQQQSKKFPFSLQKLTIQSSMIFILFSIKKCTVQGTHLHPFLKENAQKLQFIALQVFTSYSMVLMHCSVAPHGHPHSIVALIPSCGASIHRSNILTKPNRTDILRTVMQEWFYLFFRLPCLSSLPDLSVYQAYPVYQIYLFLD